MQLLTRQQAEKVMAKYLPIITSQFPNSDVGISSPAEFGDKCKVTVSYNDEIKVLDVFCALNNVEYDITDCL